MSDYKVTDTELISVANAIRTKGGTSAQLEWPSEFVEAIGNISGGGGSINILSGTDAPVASQGENGDIYLKIVQSPFICDDEYFVNSTNQLLATQSNTFYKLTNDPAIGVHYKNGSYYGPLLISTIQDGVKYTRNESPNLSVEINGVTWYISSTGYWSNSLDNPSIPTMYELGLSVNATNAEAIVRAILSASNARTSDITKYTIAAAYCKVNGVWNGLIGTNIDDVNTGTNNE